MARNCIFKMHFNAKVHFAEKKLISSENQTNASQRDKSFLGASAISDRGAQRRASDWAPWLRRYAHAMCREAMTEIISAVVAPIAGAIVSTAIAPYRRHRDRNKQAGEDAADRGDRDGHARAAGAVASMARR